MNRIFHNEQVGADRRAVDPLPGPRHFHRCPTCHEKRECRQKFCARMSEGYIKDGRAYQPVDLMCDKCAGITKPFREPKIKSSIEIKRKDHH